MGPLENYARNILKIWKQYKTADNMDHRQTFICNNHRCISSGNLDRLRHVKDVMIFRTIGT